jgi:hypothetical protein
VEQKKRRENVAAGTVGAFLGSLAGVACTVVIGQMGYVASISGLVMAVCALKGYEMLGGMLSKKGAAVSSLLILLMTFFAHRLTWAIAIAPELECSIFEAHRAIPYLLKQGMLNGVSYWGDLAMLYLFTLLGAVPTILGGLRNTGVPELPPPPASPEAAAAAGEADFYPAGKHWLRPLRLSTFLSMMPGLLIGIALLAAAVRQDAPIPLSLAALCAILSSFLVMAAALPMTRVNQAEAYLFVRAAGHLWQVNLSALNAMDTYRFTEKNVRIRAVKWDCLSTVEQERAKASILRAIALLTSGQVLPGSSLSIIVLPLTDFELVKEDRWSWHGLYSLQNGRQKKIRIAKAYPNFAPVYGLEPPQEPVHYRWGLCALALILALALGAAGYGLGGLLDGTLSGGTAAPGRTGPAAVTARMPEGAVSRYETNGVTYQVDGAFQLTGVNAFHDSVTDADYTLAVQTGADENTATDMLLQPISDYRTSPQYDYFQFANAGAEETLVPLTAADGTEYRYEILSLYLKDGRAVHVGAALAEDGLLVTVEARQGSGGDGRKSKDIRGTILYMLENLQRTGLTQAEITEENYQSLFHLAEELDFNHTAVGYIKAPYDMFGYDAFVDAHVPYSDSPVFLDGGYTLRSKAHGMEVTVTIAEGESAKDVVDQAYTALELSGADIYPEGVSDTTHFEDYDIAVKQAAYLENGGTVPRIAILYADRKQEGYYLSAQITYLPEQMDGDYPALRLELSSAYALTLPEMEPLSP